MIRKTLLIVVLLAVVSAAQDTPVGIGARQTGNTVYFSVYNNTPRTVCIFPYVQEQTNVTGSVVGMIEVGPNESGVNIGAYGQADPAQAWSINVGAKYRDGMCASQ